MTSENLSTERASLEFRALAEVIPQLVFVARADGSPDYFNRRFAEFMGESCDHYWHRVHPADIEVMRSRWTAATSAGVLFEVEHRYLRHDGVYRWFLSRAQPVKGGDGKIDRWFGTCTEIHDQKQAQVASAFLAQASEALASSLDYEATLATVARLAVPQFADWAAVDLLSAEGVVQRVEVAHADPNKAMFGWDIARKYPVNPNDNTGLAAVLKTGKPEFMQLIPPLENLISEPELLRLMKALELRSSIVVPMVARGRILGGLTFFMAESGRVYTTQDLAIAEDLGRRAGVAVDNARLYKESLNVNRMKDEFLSTLSHELRTPLTAILGWAQMLASGRGTGDALNKGLTVILRNARVQAQLIDDLLDVSRIITGKMRLEMAPLDLTEVARAAEDTLRPTADAKGVKFEAKYSEEPLRVAGDKDRLHQIFWNLLSNAIKFTPRNGRVTLVVSRRGNGFCIEVTDSGHGIRPDFLPHVFERFRQQDSSSTRKEGGLGLGLAVVRHLVELHGGTVEAKSEGLGRGATFRVDLPERLTLPTTPDLTPPGAQPAFVAPVEEELQLTGLKVLCVDDQPDTREFLSELLQSRGAIVSTAGSAGEGLARFLRNPPDVLVTDIGMPGEDGMALLHRIRTLGSMVKDFVPAIGLTAYARPEDVEAVLRAGFQRHLAKPVDPDALVRAVAELGLKKAPDR